MENAVKADEHPEAAGAPPILGVAVAAADVSHLTAQQQIEHQQHAAEMQALNGVRALAAKIRAGSDEWTMDEERTRREIGENIYQQKR